MQKQTTVMIERILVFVVSAFAFAFLAIEVVEAQGKATVLVEDLEAAHAEDDEVGRNRARLGLSALGESAIPPIRSALSNSVGTVRLDLLWALGGIEGDAAASALLELAVSDSDEAFRSAALGFLANRPISRPLSAGERAVLVELVSQLPALRAATAALVLAQCSTIPAEERARVIVSRLAKEAVLPSNTPEKRVAGSSLSVEVYELYRFILAMEAINDPASVLTVLKEHGRANPDNGAVAKWLLIGQGFTGSREAAVPLKELLLGETDASLKAVALRAYARSAKRDAIPLLEGYLKERTSQETGVPVMHGEHRDPLEVAARGELARLRARSGE